MKVKFVTGFRGRETGERYYEPGDTLDCEPNVAARLIADGKAEAVADEQPEAEQPPAKKGKKK